METHAVYAKSAPILRSRYASPPVASGTEPQREHDELRWNQSVCITLTILLSLSGALVGLLYALQEQV
jgi:hypothetical protein